MLDTYTLGCTFPFWVQLLEIYPSDNPSGVTRDVTPSTLLVSVSSSSLLLPSEDSVFGCG